MIRIEHIALWADDIERLCEFYSHYFGAGIGPRYENVSKGFSSRFISFESGARIEVMQTSLLHPARHVAGAQRMGLTHFALSLGSEQAVNEMIEKMQQAGVPVIDGPRRTGDGYYEAV
ncbi:MAG: VOC family protein, partial [Steroidobacter sp.]